MRASKYSIRILGGILFASLAALLLLDGCANTNTQTGVYATAVALTAADNVAIQYVTLPLCGPTHPGPLCSDAKITGQIKSYAQAAHDAIKAAEAAGDSATLAAANAAVAALVSVTPKA